MHPKRPVEPDRTPQILNFPDTRASAPPPKRSSPRAWRRLSRQLAFWTSRHFRSLIVLLVLLLVASSAALTWRSLQLEASLLSERQRIAELEDRLRDQQQKTAEHATHRDAMSKEMSATRDRLATVEARFEARQNVIADASQATIFLRGLYGFVDPETGRPLRYLAVDGQGDPMRGPDGQPLLTLDGEAPRIEHQFTGSAFVVSDQGHLITNRHVAHPWELDPSSLRHRAQGLEPRILRFQGYVAGSTEPVSIVRVRSSTRADVALLQSRSLAGRIAPLQLGPDEPQAGDEVVLLGYPAGLRALLARADEEFVMQLLSTTPTDDEIASRLAKRGDIAPLATRGIVGQVGDGSVVYDAESTSGGSGGPVLNLAGEVVAIHTSILPEFGGSNMGIPIAQARRLLEEVNLAAGPSPHWPASWRQAPMPRPIKTRSGSWQPLL